MSLDLLLDRMRRGKRSLDGFISFRKAVLIACAIFVVILYVGPSLFNWLFGDPVSHAGPPVSASCVDDKLFSYSSDLSRLNAHSLHSPWRPVDHNYLPYVGNGYIGLETEGEGGVIHIFGTLRHLSLSVPLKPIVQLSPAETVTDEESATIVHYTAGVVHNVRCFQIYSDPLQKVGVSSVVYAHRAIPSVLMQEIKVTNPTAENVQFNVERIGILDWKQAQSKPKVIEHGDGNQKYILVSGFSSLASDPSQVKLVVVLMRKLPSTLDVGARMTQTLNVITSVAYSEAAPEDSKDWDDVREQLVKEAVNSLLKAVGLTQLSLRQLHQDIWRSLWTTGFGISHSMAENAINGQQVNATMYYVLSQVPAPIHSAHATEQQKREMAAQLAYSEGCYGGTPTIQATSLWRSLATLEEVNSLVRSWMVTLDKNGCNKLLKAGADGVVQAMVLSFAALEFREDHLELNSHPKDLHRDFHIRRVSYGNGTHLNISIVVHTDNKPILVVALDRRNKDYFACDAGCLDAPNKLSTEPKVIPVKLTDPITAILYITSDHEHMEELKHAIHFKEVVEAPAHEHHVLALHRHGNKLGGLPTIFWFSIGFLILVFHLFLFKLIWQEYCAGQDKFRSRKFSDYQ